jgi:hypothetical protein
LAALVAAFLATISAGAPAMNEHVRRLVVPGGSVRPGDRFAALRVAGPVFKACGERQGEKLHVVCQCRCGSFVAMPLADLSPDKRLHCGCLQSSLVRAR